MFNLFSVKTCLKGQIYYWSIFGCLCMMNRKSVGRVGLQHPPYKMMILQFCNTLGRAWGYSQLTHRR